MIGIPERNIDVKCVECGGHFTIQTRKHAGNIVVKCGHCGAEQDYMVQVKKIGIKNDEPIDNLKTEMPVRILGKVVFKANRYVIEERAKVNKKTSFICPKCNKPIAMTPSSTGEQAITCKDCTTKVYITVYDAEMEKHNRPNLNHNSEEIVAPIPQPLPKPPVSEEPIIYDPEPFVIDTEDDSNETVIAPKPKRVFSNFVLQSGGGLFKTGVRFRLFTGTTIVGRRDPQTPSDIQFDDPEMSRRSIQLDVDMQSVLLTVLKDLNPVLVNGRRIPQGMSIRLTSSTKIKMGQTELTFKKM